MPQRADDRIHLGRRLFRRRDPHDRMLAATPRPQNVGAGRQPLVNLRLFRRAPHRFDVLIHQPPLRATLIPAKRGAQNIVLDQIARTVDGFVLSGRAFFLPKPVHQ